MFCLFTTHSLLLSGMPASDWRSNNQESCRLWHPLKRGYGCAAVCMNFISPSVTPVGQKLKNKLVWDALKKKKRASGVCFYLAHCISKHERATVVSSRWVAGNGSGWRVFLRRTQVFHYKLYQVKKHVFLIGHCKERRTFSSRTHMLHRWD